MSDRRILEESIRSALQRFLGSKVSPATNEDVKNAVIKTMETMSSVMEINAPIPRVEVTDDKDNPSAVSISLYDKETGEQISVAEWASRCVR